MRITLLIPFLVFTISNLQAQLAGKYTGHIVYQEGQEIAYVEGQLKIESLYDKVIYFKKLGENTYKEYPKENVSEFGLGKKLYYILPYQGNPEIFEVYSKGKAVTLLHHLKESEFALYQGDQLTYMSKSSFRDDLKALSIEKPDLSTIIDQTQYAKKSLTRTVMYINSDDPYYPQVRLGLNGGLSIQDEGGYHVGIFVDYPLEIYSYSILQFGVNYQVNSYPNLKVSRNTSSVELTSSIASISIPITLKKYMKFYDDGDKRLFNLLGLSYNYLLDDYGVFSERPTIFSGNETTTEINLNSFMGIFGGLGYEISTEKKNYFGVDLKLRFLYSFDDLEEDDLRSRLTTNLRLNAYYTF